MRKLSNTFKILLGFIISGLFLYFAFRKIDFFEMKQSFIKANYLILMPTIIVMFISHWLRSLRWQYLLKPIKKISVTNLFSALMIGYMGNSILPAHLGEFFRAYVIGRKEDISASSTMATIVIERIVDLFSLLIIMAFALILYPFPDWVRKSGYIMFFFTIGLFIFLILLKKNISKTMAFLKKFLNIFPQKFSQRIERIIYAFLNGIKGLERKRDYVVIAFLSILIWACYWLFFHINFYTFDLFQTYQINAISSLVLLVITTISVVVPSSPGYVGTYHFLCQLSLELFGVDRSVGLTYAIAVHAISILPIALVGLIFAWKEGISLIKLSQKKELSQLT